MGQHVYLVHSDSSCTSCLAPVNCNIIIFVLLQTHSACLCYESLVKKTRHSRLDSFLSPYRLYSMGDVITEIISDKIFMYHFIFDLHYVDLQTLQLLQKNVQTSTFPVWKSSWRRCSRWFSMPEPSGAASRKSNLVRLLAAPCVSLSTQL